MVRKMFGESERLIHAFRQASVIGFAVVDDRLRYEAINNCLAALHGIPAGAHLGHTVQEVLKEAGAEAASRCQEVLAHGETLHFEITNAVLSTSEQTYWRLKSCFLIQDSAGNVNEVGILVVDVTDQKRLDNFFRDIATNLDADSRENWSLSRELHEAIAEYHLGLTVSLDFLIRSRHTSTELLAKSVEGLNGRVTTLNTLISSVASEIFGEK